MKDATDEDTTASAESRQDMDLLAIRVGEQAQQLSTHARELSQLRNDVDQLKRRLDTYERGETPPASRFSQ